MLITKKILTPSQQQLLSLIFILALLAIPSSGPTASTDTSAPKIETLSSELTQANHLRTDGKTPEQFKQALSLYQQAADDGIAVAQYWLGVMHFEGKGTESDLEQATQWIHLSAKQAYQPAEELLAKLMEDAEDSDDEDEDEDDDEC